MPPRQFKLLLFLLLGAAGASCMTCGPIPPEEVEYTEFTNPELVLITGYTGDAMEPFISRDGNYLFFNSAGGATDKDLFYATRVDTTIFAFQGSISAVNSSLVDGAPSADNADRFYYVSLASYNPPTVNDTLFAGNWTGTTVTGSTPLHDLTIATPLILYFDIEASPDGSACYLSRGDFTGGGKVPSSADILLASYSGSGFVLLPDTASKLAAVNTEKLEYAAAVSADGLELFFTRYDPDNGQARIYRAVRSDPTGTFGLPRLVNAAEGFVEGPALSPDEKTLYYHRFNTVTDQYEIWRVIRP